MRRYVLVTTCALPFIIAACNGSGCSGGNQSTGLQGGGGGLGPLVDSAWKTDIPSQLADSSSTESVKVIIQFASAFTSSDSAEIVSTGGTVTSTDAGGNSNLIGATYTVGNLIALARSYTGSRITGLTAEIQGGMLSGTPTGC